MMRKLRIKYLESEDTLAILFSSLENSHYDETKNDVAVFRDKSGRRVTGIYIKNCHYNTKKKEKFLHTLNININILSLVQQEVNKHNDCTE